MKWSEASSFAAVILSSLILCIAVAGQALGADLERQTLELKLGGSDIVQTPHSIKRVSIADADVADVVVLSPREIYVFGKKVGYTSVIMWSDGRGQKSLLDVVVKLDLTGLKEKIHELYPEQEILVHGTETGIVLSGTVSGAEIVEQVIRLAQSFLPVEGEGSGRGSGRSETGKSGLGVTNLLKVGGIQQVMLEVKFAEVRRDSTRDWQAALGIGKLGKDFIGAAGVSGVLNDFTDLSGVNGTTTFPQLGQQGFTDLSLDNNQFISGLVQNPRSLLLNFAGNDPNIFVQVDNVSAGLKFLEGEGMARTLAEPRLVAQSGQEASFLAGGEFPIQRLQEEGTIDIEFKEFGVGLAFTPVVLSDGRISLRVQPSVSEIASITAISGTSNIPIPLPQFVTRKLETTVQLYDGQTLALAGLLQDSVRETVTKVPGLGDIPILGALFRSTGYQQEKTDLLIAVTPRLVKPLDKGEELRYPGDRFVPPNWFEFYLEGRLEGRTEPEPRAEEMGEMGEMSEMSKTEAPVQDPLEQATTTSFLGGGLEGQFGHSRSIIR